MSANELGPPIAYTVLQEGTPVYDRNKHRIGVVEHVLADQVHDIFEGVIVHTLPLPGRHLYVDADQIAELRERGVLLSVKRDELHEPSEEHARRAAEREAGEEPVENPLEARLRRAWDWLSER